MTEISLEPRNGTQERVRVGDHGMTLMRLSYSPVPDMGVKQFGADQEAHPMFERQASLVLSA